MIMSTERCTVAARVCNVSCSRFGDACSSACIGSSCTLEHLVLERLTSLWGVLVDSDMLKMFSVPFRW